MDNILSLFYSFCDMFPNYSVDEYEIIITLEFFAIMWAICVIILEIQLIHDKNSRKYGYLPNEYKYNETK
jgi:hypothetical protein